MRDKLQSLLIIVFVVGILIIVGFSEKSFAHPNEVYQVYLNGKKIGLIKSEQQLLDLIDKEQTSIKETFKVDKVYPPTGLNIERIYTYNEEVKDAIEIYNKIKDTEPFTINAYTVTITYPKNEDEEDVEEKEPVKLYVFDPEIINTALHNVAETFIGKDELKSFEEGTQIEISETGETITSVYFDESITIKESLVSTEKYIYKDSDSLTEFLLYGTNSEAEDYEVKEGEDLHKIAEDHELNIAELLIANPKYPNGNALLSPGEVLNVRLINPLVSIVYRKTEVEDTSLNYETEYIEDKTKYTDYTLVQQEGVDGITRITTDVQYKNGEINVVNIKKQETIKAPVNRIVVRGSKKYGGWSGTAPSLVGDTKLLWPTNVPYVITSKYEYRWGSFHKGIDISGTGWYSPIYASVDGVVIDIYKECANRGYYGSHCGGGMGNYVKVRNEESGLTFLYGHVSQNVQVKIGQKVTQGQVIGSMAMSGSSTGVHLHFQIEDDDGQTYNPCKSGLRC